MNKVDKHEIRALALNAKTAGETQSYYRQTNALNAFMWRASQDVFIALLDENEALEKRVTELEAKTVSLPKLPVLGSNADWYQGFAAGTSSMRNDCAAAIHAAGIGVNVEGKA